MSNAIRSIKRAVGVHRSNKFGDKRRRKAAKLGRVKTHPARAK